MGRISMPQGKGSQLHNKREYDRIGKPLPENIDPSRTHENVILVDIPLRDAYEQIFGDALREYNSRQRRVDRRIPDYLKHIENSKNGEKLMYEDIVQWGTMGDFKDHPELWEIAKAALTEYASTFEARNPNLRLIGAYIHMDEASPHLHIDYIPVATGYKNGLPIRNSLDRAMKQMGFAPEQGTESRKNNATKCWKENERSVFGEICRGFGLTVEAERKARGSLSVQEYKDARDKMLGEIEREKTTLDVQVKKARAALDAVSTEPVPDTQVRRSVLGNRVSIPTEGFGVLTEQAKAYRLNKPKLDSAPKREAAIKQREQDVSRREKAIQKAEEWEKYCNEQDGIIASLERKNASLERKIRDVETEVELWKNRAQRLWERLRAIVRAVAHLLKHTVVTEDQASIADAVVELGENTARELEQDGVLPEGSSERMREPSVDDELRNIIEPEQPTFRRGPRL